MDENELEEWYEDEKERISKEYQANLGSDEDLGEKNARKENLSSKEAEKKFLSQMKNLHLEYQKRYDQLKDKEEKSKKGKEKRNRIIKPLFTGWKTIFKYLMMIFNSAKNSLISLLGPFFSNIRKACSNLFYNYREYYIFHMRKHTLKVIRPVKMLIRFLLKPVHKATAYLGKWFKETKKTAMKELSRIIQLVVKYAKIAFEFLTKYSKIVFTFLAKVFKKISEFNNKRIKPLFKWMEVFTKMFKKKEEGEEE